MSKVNAAIISIANAMIEAMVRVNDDEKFSDIIATISDAKALLESNTAAHHAKGERVQNPDKFYYEGLNAIRMPLNDRPESNVFRITKAGETLLEWTMTKDLKKAQYKGKEFDLDLNLSAAGFRQRMRAFAESVTNGIDPLEKIINKAEPKKAEPKKAEPKKAEPKKAEPKKAEPKKAEPKKAEPKKAEPEADDVWSCKAKLAKYASKKLFN